MPPPPPTFSIVTGWPSNSESDGARIRPRRSAPPPAANGTTMVSGRLGHSCAGAMPGKLTMSAAASSVDEVRIEPPTDEVSRDYRLPGGHASTPTCGESARTSFDGVQIASPAIHNLRRERFENTNGVPGLPPPTPRLREIDPFRAQKRQKPTSPLPPAAAPPSQVALPAALLPL